MSISAVSHTPSWPAIAGGANTPGSSGKTNSNQQFAAVLQATNSQTQSGSAAASLASSQHPHHHAHSGARSHAAGGSTATPGRSV